MSTRSNIILGSPLWNEQLYFYKHMDGYPDGVAPYLNTFVRWLREGYIRNNVEQSAGWLIVMGTMEQLSRFNAINFKNMPEFYGWKVGDIELATCIHGDIEHLYYINVDTMNWYELKFNFQFKTYHEELQEQITYSMVQ